MNSPNDTPPLKDLLRKQYWVAFGGMITISVLFVVISSLIQIPDFRRREISRIDTALLMNRQTLLDEISLGEIKSLQTHLELMTKNLDIDFLTLSYGSQVISAGTDKQAWADKIASKLGVWVEPLWSLENEFGGTGAKIRVGFLHSFLSFVVIPQIVLTLGLVLSVMILVAALLFLLGRRLKMTLIDPLISITTSATEQVAGNTNYVVKVREIKIIADAIQENQQLKVKAAIAQTTQMLAHDVRKPFSMLRMGLSMLSNAKDPAAVKAVMSRIVPEIDKAMSSVDGMIADVMEVGSVSTNLIQEPASPESLIEATLGEVIRMYPDANIAFDYELKHTHMANVHVQKIGRVFSNIVGNAFQAMRKKGQMWFKTSESDGMITFCIGNAGSVIPAESLPKLFEAFFTSGKKGGTGLGLAIAQKVVNAHGGKIWCESSMTAEYPSGMVEFFFTLPITTDRLNRTTATLPRHSSDISKKLVMLANSAPASLSIDKGDLSLEEDVVEAHKVLGRPLRVLIIDDEAIYRGALASHLSRTPELVSALEITQGGGSNDALKAASQSTFDLVITDVDMGPDSLDGFELVRELRRLGAKSLICVHSNRIVAADNKTAIESGADNFMPKPMARAQLLRIVLQAASAAKAEPKHEDVPNSVTFDSKPNVLVIDDDNIVVYSWQHSLSRDTNLCIMRSFEELQDKIASDPNFIQSLHFVVTDMHLDGSKGDGLDVGRLIKSLRPDLQILMSSNDIFEPHELVGAVDKLIAKEAVGLEELRALAAT